MGVESRQNLPGLEPGAGNRPEVQQRLQQLLLLQGHLDLLLADRPGSLEPLDWGSLGEEQDVLLLCVNDLAVFQGDLHPACLAEQKGEGGGKDLLPPGGRGTPSTSHTRRPGRE